MLENRRHIKVTLYTDGACEKNPGPGGYGIVLHTDLPKYGMYEKEYSGGYLETTNNRMELMAVIAGLEALHHSYTVTVYSDSKYVTDAINKGWMKSWYSNRDKRTGLWKRGSKKKDDIKNHDLWIRLHQVLKLHRVSFIWVKGHADNPMNERCDELAVAARKSANHMLREDHGHGLTALQQFGIAREKYGWIK